MKDAQAMLERMRVPELRLLLKNKGLNCTGNKTDLIATLEQHRLDMIGSPKHSEEQSAPKASKKREKTTPVEPVAKKAKVAVKKPQSLLLGGELDGELKLLLRPFLPDAVCDLVQQYVLTSIGKLRTVLKSWKHPFPWVKRDLTTEACLLLLTVEDATRTVTVGKKAKKKQIRGWGSKTLYGVLKGSRASAIRKTGATTTLGYGDHLPEDFWEKMLGVLCDGFLEAKWCQMQFGGGYSYLTSDLGKQILADVPTSEILSMVTQTRAEMEDPKNQAALDEE